MAQDVPHLCPAVLAGLLLLLLLAAGCTMNMPPVSVQTAATTAAPNGTGATGTTASSSTQADAGGAASASTTAPGTAAVTSTSTGPNQAIVGTTTTETDQATVATSPPGTNQSTAGADSTGAVQTTASSGKAPVTTTQDPMTCTAGFTGTPTSGPAPLTVTFTASNTCSTIWTHEWNFGDGTESQVVDGATKTVTHIYTSPGTYTVHLTDDDHYLEDGETKVGYITVTGTGTVTPTPTHCKSDFTEDKTSGPAPLTITFTSTSPCDAQTYVWWFSDDGPTSQIEGGKVQTYTFEKPGTYAVRLTEKFYDPVSGEYYLDIREKAGFEVTDGLVVNPSLHITNLPTLKLTPKVTYPASVPTLLLTPKPTPKLTYSSDVPNLALTPKVTLIQPGVTLDKEKPGIVIDPVGPISRG